MLFHLYNASLDKRRQNISGHPERKGQRGGEVGRKGGRKKMRYNIHRTLEREKKS